MEPQIQGPPQWRRLGLDDSAQVAREWERLIAVYNAPDRHYHNLLHIDQCLTLLDEAKSLCQYPDDVRFALWFHDAVYDTHAGDNEQRSASWAAAVLQGAGASDERIARVRRLILATRHAEPPQDADEAVITDVDLSILGRDDATFWRYERAIRQEYDWVADIVFRAKRAEILRVFLARERIFHTPVFRERYEAQARVNLAAAIAALGQSHTARND